MEHLTVDAIINFVSLTELNSEAIELSAAVNGHIRKCDKCLKLVRSFQLIYDEFSRLDQRGKFNKNIFDNVLAENSKDKNTVQTQTEHNELDDYR